MSHLLNKQDEDVESDSSPGDGHGRSEISLPDGGGVGYEDEASVSGTCIPEVPLTDADVSMMDICSDRESVALDASTQRTPSPSPTSAPHTIRHQPTHAPADSCSTETHLADFELFHFPVLPPEDDFAHPQSFSSTHSQYLATDIVLHNDTRPPAQSSASTGTLESVDAPRVQSNDTRPSAPVEAIASEVDSMKSTAKNDSPMKAFLSLFSKGKEQAATTMKKASTAARKATGGAKTKAKKRGHEEVASDGDDERPAIKKRVFGQRSTTSTTSARARGPDAVGISRTTVRARIQNEALADGSFQADEKKLAKFRNKIHELDPEALFDDDDILRVQHDLCGEWIRMGAPYQIKAFKQHVHGREGRNQPPCTGPGQAPKRRTNKIQPRDVAWNRRLENLVGGVVKGLKKCFVDKPCPGLRVEANDKVGRYLERTPATGGGGPSVARLTLEFYPKAEDFSSLTPAQKEDIRATQHSQYRWRNETKLGRVVSQRCLTSVRAEEIEGVEKDAEPCIECNAILEDKNFKVAIARALPDADNFKFTPTHFLGEAERSAEKYARATGLQVLMDAHKKVSSHLLVPRDLVSHVSCT